MQEELKGGRERVLWPHNWKPLCRYLHYNIHVLIFVLFLQASVSCSCQLDHGKSPTALSNAYLKSLLFHERPLNTEQSEENAVLEFLTSGLLETATNSVLLCFSFQFWVKGHHICIIVGIIMLQKSANATNQDSLPPAEPSACSPAQHSLNAILAGPPTWILVTYRFVTTLAFWIWWRWEGKCPWPTLHLSLQRRKGPEE